MAAKTASLSKANVEKMKNEKSIFEFTAKDIDGKECSLEKYK